MPMTTAHIRVESRGVQFMHQGEIHNFPEIAERFRWRHTHFPGNSRTVPKSTKSASEYLLGCLHGLTVCTWIYSPGVLSRRQPASSKSDPHVHCRENKRTVYRGKSQKRNKKEFVGRGCWAVASSGGASAPGPRARARAKL